MIAGTEAFLTVPNHDSHLVRVPHFEAEVQLYSDWTCSSALVEECWSVIYTYIVVVALTIIDALIRFTEPQPTALHCLREQDCTRKPLSSRD